MANIELKIVALGDFSSVNTAIKSLQAQVELLQKSVAGVGLNPQLTSQLKSIQAEFSSALMSSGNFTKSTVQLTSETEKFGKALQSGKLSLGQYFGIITGKSAEARKAVEALAVEQVKLNNSIVQSDITKQGLYSVYTPTKINEISKATEIAAAKQNIYNLAVREGSTQLINFGKNTQWAGRQLTVGLAMPMVLFGSQAVKAFQDVNTELVRLQKVYGTGLVQPTKQALTDISSQVTALSQELAKSMGIAAKDTASMAADLAATGKTGNDLVVATREAMRLSKLGEMSTQDAMQTTISLQNVYKLSTKDLSGAINFLNAVENQTSTSLQDLAAGIPKVGPIVQQLGGSFKDTAVMMVAMKEAGVPAAQSANAIKSAIASLINPTKAAQTAFRAYGIDVASIATSTGGNPIKMILALQSALKGLAPLAQSQLIEKLFGKFQEARIQALITNLGSVNSQTRAAFDLANASAPQLAAMAASELKIANESVTGKWKRAVETLKADLVPIGQKIMEVATKILDFGAKIANFFNKLPGPIKTGLGILLTLGVLSGPIIMITGLLANLVGQGMKVGYSLLGIVNGTKKWKDLLTPTSIAAKTATEAFNEGLLTNIRSVDVLNVALQRMITNIEAINAANSMGAGGLLSGATGIIEKNGVAGVVSKVEKAGIAGVIGKVEKAAATVAAEQLMFPGMATGGYVPGNPSQGDVYPALLMGGEAVIPTKQAQQYAPFISKMIDGTLPQHAFGTGKVGQWLGKKIGIQRGHALSEHPEGVVEQFNQPEMLAQTGLDSVVSVVRGLMLAMFTNTNQGTKSTRSGKTGAEIAEGYRSVQATGVDPLENLKNQARLLGVDMQKFVPKIDKAFEEFLQELETTKANYRYGGKKARERAEKEGQAYGGSLEAHTENSLGPVIDKTPTSGKNTLGNILRRIAGTRGGGRGKASGSTGNTFFEETPGNFIPIEKSQELKSYSGLARLKPTKLANEFSTIASYEMDNLTSDTSSRSKAEIDALEGYRAQAGAAVDRGFNSPEGIHANSDSKKGIRSAKDFIGGVKTGLKEGKTGVEKEAANIGDTVDKTVQGRFNKAFGANSKLGGMISKFSNMGMVGRMGVGMGLGMVSQLAGPMISKLPGGNLITDAMTGASMGAGFGPWGLAAGAAIGLVNGGIRALIASEKQHAAEAKADFTSSGDAVKFMGGTVADTTTALHDFSVVNISAVYPALKTTEAAVTKLAKGIVYTTSELDAFKKSVAGLPKDDPLSLLIKQISGASPENAAKWANAFVTTQMAINNLSLSEAEKLQQLILTLGGQNPNVALGLVTNQIDAVKTATTAALPSTSQFSEILGQLVMAAANSTTLKDYTDRVIALGAAAGTSAQQLAALFGYFSNQPGKGAAVVAELISQMQSSGKGFTSEDVAAAVAALNNGKTVEFDKLKPGQVRQELGDPFQGISKERKAALIEQAALQKKLADAQSGANVAAAGATEATKKNLPYLKQQQKLLDANLKSLQDLQRQQSQNTSYATTKEDLKNQILMAQSTGDNLKAQLLQQQLLGTTRDFTLQNQVNSAQQLSDANRIKLDEANAAVQTAQTNATNNNSKLIQNLTAAIDALALKISKMPNGTVVYGPTSGQTAPEAKKENAKRPNAGDQVFDPKTGTFKTAGPGPDQAPFKDPTTPKPQIRTDGKQDYPENHPHPLAPKRKDGTPIHNYPITKLPAPYNMYTYYDKKSGYSWDPVTGQVYDSKMNPIDLWAGADDQGIIRGFARGGVARTNSGITYHKQHMNRTSRHFDSGGRVRGPGTGTSDSIPAYLSNGEYVVKADSVSHYGTGLFDSLNAKHFAKGGQVAKNSTIWADEWKGMKAALDFMGVTSLVNVLRGKGKKSDAMSIASMIPGGKLFKGTEEVAKLSTVAYKAAFAARDAEEAAKAAKLAEISKLPGFNSVEAFIQSPVTGYRAEGSQGISSFLDKNNLVVPHGYEKYRALSSTDLEQLSKLKVGDVWHPAVPKSFSSNYQELLKYAPGVDGRPKTLMGNWSLDQISKITPTNWAHNGGVQGINDVADIGRPTGVAGEGLFGPNVSYRIKQLPNPSDSHSGYVLEAFNTPKMAPNSLGKMPLQKLSGIQRNFGDYSNVFTPKWANGGLIKLPSFNVGTNFVPHDMIAQIHKGERIIPASQNNGTMGNTYNITVNAGTNASAKDIANEVMNTIKRQDAMSGRKTRVGN